MKKKGVNINVHLSNRMMYILVLVIVGVGVYAYGTSNPAVFGHSIREIGLPSCTNGQVLGVNSSGGWGCITPSTLTETDPKVGMLINNKWCTSNGTQVICNSDPPSSIVLSNLPSGSIAGHGARNHNYNPFKCSGSIISPVVLTQQSGCYLGCVSGWTLVETGIDNKIYYYTCIKN